LADALRDFQTILAMARHAAEGPDSICSVIGVAIAMDGLRDYADVLQHAKAPNLYWSLTDLPQPYCDVRRALQGDRLAFHASMIPGADETVRQLKTRRLTPEELEKIARGWLETDKLTFAQRIALAFRIERADRAARRTVIDSGLPSELVESMDSLQVAMLHALTDFDRVCDEMVKLQNLPYPEITSRIAERERSRKEHRTTSIEPALSLLPDLHASTMTTIVEARARLDRHIAALRCVEAIRLYAATHGSELPTALDQIKEVPIPLDPMTGKPFEYKVTDKTATLSAIRLLDPHRDNAVHYEIQFRR
jgi:hypothetical protein